MISKKHEEAVSPVIGVMLMIVVTIIVAAAVSAFAGQYANDDKKAPTAVISCQALSDRLLFTHESGDYVDLIDCNLVLTNGENTRRFTGATDLEKVSMAIYSIKDRQINTGNQFYLEADNNGSSAGGGYLGWDETSDDPAFYLTKDEIGTYRILDRESGQTISEGVISV
ncbi:flagellin-like protein [Methanomicrobium sp. W14]|uniref:type IV pilin n=1 Tax=Methanomicrobium sp. W14 TaxID=2817839 RepID=UPI001AE66F1D|nr:type IV pilin N-terminal domain-containing protein [Methanomicrobium sp. W14]MBP2133476.1 flagellin-like protein [Methanomicrobium sp. W14]